MPNIPPALKEAVAALCLAVEVRLLDGHDLNLGALARAASNAFLVGGLSAGNLRAHTIEAMASRLPVVVSDWNGYRDTVVEGAQAFASPPIPLSPAGKIFSFSSWHMKTLPQIPSALASAARSVWML